MQCKKAQLYERTLSRIYNLQTKLDPEKNKNKPDFIPILETYIWISTSKEHKE